MLSSNPICPVCNYATSAVYRDLPTPEQLANGVKPLDSLPAAWWNCMWNMINCSVNQARGAVGSFITELNNVLAGAGICPNCVCTDQLYRAIDRIRQTIGNATVAGAVKSSATPGMVSIDNNGFMTANCVGNATQLATSARTLVGAVNELKTTYDTCFGSVSTALDGKAPISHASSATTYGVGTASAYGHLRISGTYTSDLKDAGMAASQSALYNVYNYATQISAAAIGLGNIAGCSLGTASAGTAATAARSDHVHPIPSCVTDKYNGTQYIGIGYSGPGLTAAQFAHFAAYSTSYETGCTVIKDISADNVKQVLGLGSAAYCDTTDFRSCTWVPAITSLEGTLGIAHGGTGQTTANAAANAFINSLSTGESTPKDGDYFISQYVGGGADTCTYHRRPMSKLWGYIEGKADSVYAKLSHTHTKSQITDFPTSLPANGGTADYAKKIKPNYVEKTITRASTLSTKYIKIAACLWSQEGTLKVYFQGENLEDTLIINFGGGNATTPTLCGHYTGNNKGVIAVIAQKGSAFSSDYSIYVKIRQYSTCTVRVALLTGNCTIDISETTTIPTNISQWPVDYGFFGDVCGAATCAHAVMDYCCSARPIQIAYSGATLACSQVSFLAAYSTNLESGKIIIKDAERGTILTWLGLGSAAYCDTTDFRSNTWVPDLVCMACGLPELAGLGCAPSVGWSMHNIWDYCHDNRNYLISYPSQDPSGGRLQQTRVDYATCADRALCAGQVASFGDVTATRNSLMRTWSVYASRSSTVTFVPECDIVKAIYWATNNFETAHFMTVSGFAGCNTALYCISCAYCGVYAASRLSSNGCLEPSLWCNTSTAMHSLPISFGGSY